eukprot:scaffold7729_cov120-Isochrysis_galbana.AAC.5
MAGWGLGFLARGAASDAATRVRQDMRLLRRSVDARGMRQEMVGRARGAAGWWDPIEGSAGRKR